MKNYLLKVCFERILFCVHHDILSSGLSQMRQERAPEKTSILCRSLEGQKDIWHNRKTWTARNNIRAINFNKN